jgi:hypothetical protein
MTFIRFLELQPFSRFLQETTHNPKHNAAFEPGV